jgi:hypothetical protein
VIVRIMTDNQYRLADEHMAEVRRMDDALEAALESGDAPGFQSTLRQLIDFVRQNGQRVPDEEVIPSDVMIPAPDMTLDEARARLHTADVKPNSGGTGG